MMKRITPVASAVTGVSTGLFGSTVPIVGMAVGVIVQILEPTVPALKPWAPWYDGVVDGAAALLGRRLFTGPRAAAYASGDGRACDGCEAD